MQPGAPSKAGKLAAAWVAPGPVAEMAGPGPMLEFVAGKADKSLEGVVKGWDTATRQDRVVTLVAVVVAALTAVVAAG